jgi:hypothetical protein
MLRQVGQSLYDAWHRQRAPEQVEHAACNHQCLVIALRRNNSLWAVGRESGGLPTPVIEALIPAAQKRKLRPSTWSTEIG